MTPGFPSQGGRSRSCRGSSLFPLGMICGGSFSFQIHHPQKKASPATFGLLRAERFKGDYFRRSNALFAVPLAQNSEGFMRKERIVRPKQRTAIAVTLLDGELDELIECVANAADRAESGSYDMAGTPKAKAIATERAKRLYALASRLENARNRRE
jgi:hypothetical protein